MQAAGPAGSGAGREVTRELRLCPRCKGAGLLMAHVDPLDLAGIDGVGDAVQGVTDDSVTPLHAGRLQRFDQDIRHSLTHRGTSCVTQPKPSWVT